LLSAWFSKQTHEKQSSFEAFLETILRQKQVLLIPNWGYEVLQILSISLMDKIPLVDLFKRTDFNNVKELDCPLFPGLFD